MLLAATLIGLSAAFTFLVFLWVRSRSVDAAPIKSRSLMPDVGLTVSGQFRRGTNHLRVFFQVEEREGNRLRLQILSELGSTSFEAIGSGTSGQLDVGDYYFPIQIIEASLPRIEVEAFPSEARPVRRESVRIPVSFTVRIRLLGSSTGRWEAGKGVNISANGVCLFSESPAPPHQRRFYEFEITLTDLRAAGEKLAGAGEVRWSQRVKGGTMVGLLVTEGAKRKELARLVSRVQHRIARRPEDYLSESTPKAS
jgi:hypothetical protein